MQKLRDIMTRNVYCLKPEQPLPVVISEFERRCISGAPVTDGEGVVIGLLCRTAMLRHLSRQQTAPDQLTVGDVMETGVFQARPDDTVQMAMATLLPGRFHRLIVTDEASRAVGIVTSIDLMEAFYNHLERQQYD